MGSFDASDITNMVGAEVTVGYTSSESIPDVNIIYTDDEDIRSDIDYNVSSSYNMDDDGASNANQIIRPRYSDTPPSQQSQLVNNFSNSSRLKM